MSPRHTVKMFTYTYPISLRVTVTIFIKFVPTTPRADHDDATLSFFPRFFHQIPARTTTLGALFHGFHETSQREVHELPALEGLN